MLRRKLDDSDDVLGQHTGSRDPQRVGAVTFQICERDQRSIPSEPAPCARTPLAAAASNADFQYRAIPG